MYCRRRLYYKLRWGTHTRNGVRPEDSQQKGVGRPRRQSELSVSLRAQDRVPLLHLRDAGLAAPRARQARVLEANHTERRNQGRVSFFRFTS